ncbi:uncharacterized protein CPUR_08650 [Claviceps purpurea 20.1]|uniref:F-box domain-containing protein n=1 Tax=Claviceps purpurea (strain 20.1) TaxID=1111077 RepID=M1WIM0_CLAP2|nr:uncharacterized protein CPUR_08650 [Claviceps purpurea 20.1]
MDSTAREARVIARERDTDESRCPMALLPPEMKHQIMSYISTQQSLSRLGQSCRAWYVPATQELYTRDAKEHTSFAIKWMAAHAVDEQTTDSALRTLEISRRWGGQIDAVKRRLSRSDGKDQIMYDTSTALHFAVFLGNMRLTETLLAMKASLTIPCSTLLWKSMGSKKLLLRCRYFMRVLHKRHFGPAFPIFLAFLQSYPDMCKLLMERGAGREAMIFDFDTIPEVISILHFAAADPTTDYRQWQCLFDGFREYIDETRPRGSQSTPLHTALKSRCTQGMQMAVEYGADKEARDGASRTPLSIGVRGIPYCLRAGPRTFEEHSMCFRKFVELGANVNPEGDSVLIRAVQSYAPRPVDHPIMRHLIHFLLEHHADIHGTGGRQNTNVVNELITGFLDYDHNPLKQEPLKELLTDLVDRGLNLTIPAPGLPSPLYRVLDNYNAKSEWLFDSLCDNGATIHENEVDAAFLRWCEISRLWKANEHDAWWQHQGQEDEIFQKWCDDPYNTWWWRHVKQISPHAATQAYGAAFKHEDRQLYDILTHLPLPTPSDDLLLELAYDSVRLWSWMLVMLRKLDKDFVAAGLPPLLTERKI